MTGGQSIEEAFQIFISQGSLIHLVRKYLYKQLARMGSCYEVRMEKPAGRDEPHRALLVGRKSFDLVMKCNGRPHKGFKQKVT